MGWFAWWKPRCKHCDCYYDSKKAYCCSCNTVNPYMERVVHQPQSRYIMDHEHQWSDFSLQCQNVYCEAVRPLLDSNESKRE